MKMRATKMWVALSLVGAAAAQNRNALDKPTFESYLRKLEIYRTEPTYKIGDPIFDAHDAFAVRLPASKDQPGYFEVDVHVGFPNGLGDKDEVFYISRDGQTIRDTRGNVYDINKSPFQSNLDRLTLAGAPSFGPADAPVTIVEFGDLECPDCRAEAPLLRTEVPKAFPGKVRVFFKDFPLDSIHPWARAAAIAGRCVYHQDAPAFWKFYDWIYDNQDEINPGNVNAKIVAWAGQSGLDGVQLGRCMETRAMESEVDRSVAEAKALGAQGTPTLFINGRRIGGLAWPDLQLVIGRALK
jgi:protein-disulfide isomerase